MSCNQTVICGQIVERGVLRYSPAGVAIIEFTVQHASRQQEAGIVRQVTVDIPAVALEQMASAIAEMKLGSTVKLTGFLNRKSHYNPQAILHASHIEPIN